MLGRGRSVLLRVPANMAIEVDNISRLLDRDDQRQRTWDDQTLITATTRPSDIRRDRLRVRGTGDDIRKAGTERCLEVQAVGKSFAGREVVKGVSLHVERGEAVSLLGPGQAGKTTLFHLITGLIPADRGRIKLDGHDITSQPMYRRARMGIGYVPKDGSTFGGFDVEHNIRTVLDAFEPDSRQRDPNVEALLDEFNLAGLRNKMSNTLLGSERRRVEIARAMAARPAFLLLNEPFAGVEPTGVDEIQARVRHLARRGMGILIAEQMNQTSRQALEVSDRAYVICSGDLLGTLMN